MQLGEILKHSGVVTDQQLATALQYQRSHRERLGSALIKLGFADNDAVATALATQKDVSAARAKHFARIDAATVGLMDRRIAARLHAVPLGIATKQYKELVVALRDPDDIAAIDEIAFATGYRVRPVAAPELIIDEAIESHYGAVRAEGSTDDDPPAEVAEPVVEPVESVAPVAFPANPTPTRTEVERFRTEAIAEITFGHRREEAIDRLRAMGATREMSIQLVDEAIDERDATYRGRGIIELALGLLILLAVGITYSFLNFSDVKSPMAHVLFGFVAIVGIVLVAGGIGHVFFGGKGEQS